MSRIVIGDGGILKGVFIPKDVTIIVKGKGVIIKDCKFEERKINETEAR